MSLYIKQLQDGTKAILDARAAAEQRADLVTIEAAEARLAPLSERLGRLLASIPDSVQRSGLGIPELQRLLRGRQGRQAHQGEIAAALRSRNWTPRRDWTGRGSADGARSRWRPPPDPA